MNSLIIMVTFCTVFAAISQRRSESIGRRHFYDREQLFFTVLICYMIIFAGLRTYYNDTYAYIRSFNNSAKLPDILSNIDWTLGENPGFKIFMALIKLFSDNVNVFLMLSSAVALYPTIWFIRKYTKSFAFAIFLFFMLGYYTFTLAAIKQTIATAIALIAVDRYLSGKKLRYYLYMLLALTFHVYVLVYFITPILLKQVPWQKGTWLLILTVLLVAYSFNFLVGSILSVTDILGDTYDRETFVGEGINIFRVMVYFVPTFISLYWKGTLFRDSSKNNNLFVNMSIVCSLIMFIGLFGNANMFSRLAIFLEPPIYIALPWMLYKLKDVLSGMVLKIGSYFAYPLFFYYQMVVTTQFDTAFKSITIAQFFNSLFS